MNNTRKLVASLACRAGGSRLYGKPLQNIGSDKRILDLILDGVSSAKEIDSAVLCISEGIENQPFVDVAHQNDIPYIFGSEKDVLWRLILGGRFEKATDVFRVTTECPFITWELLPEVWAQHCNEGNDITVTDFLPEGMNFEIYSLEALERMHRDGNDGERSEYCSAYPRRCPEEFKIGLVAPPDGWQRPDIRLTVDYPEDLVLCRKIYEDHRELGPHIPTGDILQCVDEHPEVHRLVEPYVDDSPLWAHVISK